MEAVGVVRPEARDRRINKRMRLSPSDSPPRTRRQSDGMQQNGQTTVRHPPEAKTISTRSVSHSTQTPPTTQTALLASVNQHRDTGLQTSQAQDPEPRLHNTDTDRSESGHHYSSTIQNHRPGPAVGSSAHGPGAMSITGFQPTSREDSFSPATSSPSLRTDADGQTYNPSFQHQQQWSAPSHSADIRQPHFQTLVQPHLQEQPQPPSVSPHFVYTYFSPQQQVLGLSGHGNALSANADAVAPGQQTNTLPPHHLLVAGQPPSISEESAHLQHHQVQQAFFQTHQGPQGFQAGHHPSSFQPVSVQGLRVPPAAVSYPSPVPYYQAPMGGGEYIPIRPQAARPNDVAPPIVQTQNISYVGSGYPIGEVAAGQTAPAPLGAHSYCQSSNDSNADVQHQANYHHLEGYGDGGGSGGDDAPAALGDIDNNEATSHGSADDLESVKGIKTAETRRIKACTRCRTQKMRCDIDPEDPKGPCKGCKSFSKTSKKTIHLTPCFRGKITDAVLYRSGGLELTHRWTGTEMKDIAERVQPIDIREIEFTLGIWREPIVVKVVAFHPIQGDVTARYWIVREEEDDVRKKRELAHFCLADIHETAKYFEQYVVTHAKPAMQRQRTGPVRLEGGALGVIEKTYLAAIHYHDKLKADMNEGAEQNLDREKSLLDNLFIFWFALRHTTGSSYLCGKETLDMKPETRDPSYPLLGKLSVPRMILAQFDSINHTRLLTKYSKLVLAELESLMSRNDPRFWFTIYLCLFILLREASWMTEDRYRHARNNCGRKMRYTIPAFVENLQDGCNNLLQHWHYYNCKPWPDPANPWDRHKSLLSHLYSEHYDLVMETMTDPAVQKQLNVWRRYKAENGYVALKHIPGPLRDNETGYQGSQSQYDWDHPFYWISQLFEEQWFAHPTYQREYPN